MTTRYGYNSPSDVPRVQGDPRDQEGRCHGDVTEMSRRCHGDLRSWGRGMLRYAVMMVVMMVVGSAMNEAWGQIAEGFYYIASNQSKADNVNNKFPYSSTNPSNNFYLCPAIGCYYDNNIDQPHLTTFQTNQDQNSLWKIVAVSGETNYFYLIHYKTGKYLASNETPNYNIDGNTNRKVVHLEKKAANDDSDIYKFYIKNNSGTYQIYPKDYRPGGTLTNASSMSLNVKGDNWSMYVPYNGLATGIIGLYTYSGNKGSEWKIEPLTSTQPCATPVIKYSGDQINISYPYSDETGITIYYTTDGTEPTTSSSSQASNNFNISASGVVKVRAFATKSGYADSDEAVLWGSAKPFLIQSKEDANYYLVPAGNGTDVTTTSIAGESMKWTFQNAGASTDGLPYYYLVTSNNKKINYTFNSANNTYTLSLNDASVDANKFCIIEDGITGEFFLIPISGASTGNDRNCRALFKNNGNVKYDAAQPGIISGSNADNINRVRWLLRVCNDGDDQKNLFSAPPFNVSNDNETHYYHIQSVGTSGYYIVPPSSPDGNATTSDTDYDDTPWLFKIAATDNWLTYYYIISAASGKYMYFNKNFKKTSEQASVISMKDVSEKDASNEERFQFVMVRSTTTDACYIVPKGYSYADDSHINFNGNKYYGLCLDESNPLKTTWSRQSDANNVKWTFHEATITDLYLDPVITQDENGYVSITHPTVACDYYFTTDSSTPSVPANAGTAPTDPTNKFAAPFLPEVGVTQITAKAVSKDVYTVSSDAVTYNLPEYTQPTITYDYENNTITISTEVGARVYYNYGVDPSNPTINPSVTTQTFTTDPITNKTIVKALAVKEGWAPSELNTMTVHKPTIELSASTATYDKTDHTPTITVKDGDNVFDSGKYTVSYQKDGGAVSDFINAGTYSVVVSDVAGDNEIVSGSTTFTINPRALTVTADNKSKEYGDPDPELTCTVSGLLEGDVLTSPIIREEGDNTGTYDIIASPSLSNTNYTVGTFNGATFTITPKNLGSGSTPAPNITCDVTEEGGTYNVVVKQGGSNLTLNTDYTKDYESNGDKYYEVTIAGTGNYENGFTVKLAKIHLSKLTGSTEPGGAALFVSDSGDGYFEVPDNMTAYIVTGISGNTLITKPVDNIPEQVPVLLLSDIDTNSFLVNTTTGTPPSGTNLLKEVTDDPSKYFAATAIYLLYKGEFVLNTPGNLAKGKVYLERPDYISAAPVKLFIRKDIATGIDEQWTMDNGQWRMDNEAIYDVSGRRVANNSSARQLVNSSTLRKGVYIINGRKVVIK